MFPKGKRDFYSNLLLNKEHYLKIKILFLSTVQKVEKN